MSNLPPLRGIELRYALTMQLFDDGPASIADLIDALASRGLEIAGAAPKSVSDALRWEMGHDRVRRLGRGRYGPGWMPRGTEHRIHQRVLALRARAQIRSKAGTTNALFPGDASGGCDDPSGAFPASAILDQ